MRDLRLQDSQIHQQAVLLLRFCEELCHWPHPALYTAENTILCQLRIQGAAAEALAGLAVAVLTTSQASSLHFGTSSAAASQQPTKFIAALTAAHKQALLHVLEPHPEGEACIFLGNAEGTTIICVP